MDKEYDFLRKEILEGQNRRFTIISGTTAIVTAFIGWVVNNPTQWTWTLSSALLLLIISSANYLTWFFGQSNARIGTYLEVFHESIIEDIGWEGRNRRFGIKMLNLNTGIALIYLGLGTLSIIMPFTVCTKVFTLMELIFFCIILVIYSFTLILLFFKSYPRAEYLNIWRKVKNEEK